MRKYPQSTLWSIHALRSDIQTRPELDETERDFIKFLRAQDPEYGYNICRGGEGRTGPLSPEERVKFQAANYWTNYWAKQTLIGQVFGKLTVQSEAGKDNQGKKLWNCQCTCGNHTTIRTNPLRSGSIKSCGCLISEAGRRRWAKLNMVGRIFGRLTVQSKTGRDKRQQRLWNCLCVCGNTTIVKTNTLMTGNSKSCGCVVLGQRKESPKNSARQAAILKGELLYFTGNPCKHKHIGLRRVINGRCLECENLQRAVLSPEGT